jgi:hypothetical protein
MTDQTNIEGTTAPASTTVTPPEPNPITEAG